jgi:toxin HigB-1
MLRCGVIQNFRRRGLRRLFEHGDGSKVSADQLRRISDVLFHLDRARVPGDLDLPGYRLHRLKGDLQGYWSVTISGNWRIVFRFENGAAFDVDLIDYH